MSKTLLGSAIQEAAAIVGAKPVTVADSVLAAITAELKASGTFALPGFGTFTVRETGAREGRNPSTGAAVNIAAGRTVRFKPSHGLREELLPPPAAKAGDAKAAKAAKPAKAAKAAKTPPAPAPAPIPAAGAQKRRAKAAGASNGATAQA